MFFHRVIVQTVKIQCFTVSSQETGTQFQEVCPVRAEDLIKDFAQTGFLEESFNEKTFYRIAADLIVQFIQRNK